MLLPAILSVVVGIAMILVAAWIAADTGPGSGFRGYTTGHRLKMAFIALVGVLMIGQGVWFFYASPD